MFVYLLVWYMEKEEYYAMYTHEQSHWWYITLHHLVVQYVRRVYKKKKRPLRIFDLGCGTGGMMQKLAPYGMVEGLDVSADAIALAQKRGLHTALQGDANTWSPAAATYDVIISLDVLYHRAIHDEQAILQQCFTALRPGGMCVFNLPAFPLLSRQHDARVYGQRRYKRTDLCALVERAGFRVQVATYRLPHMFCLILCKKLFQYFLPQQAKQSDLATLLGVVNNFFLFLGAIENWLILHHIRFSFGSSIFIIAKK